MTKKKVRKIFIVTMSVFLFLTLVLAIHIYIVTRPKAADLNTLVMARIDIKNSLNQADAAKITTWLYQQKGVNHVLVNPETKIVVFTYFPVKQSGDQIVKNFQTSFNYDATRHIPTKEEVESGCPALPENVTTKIGSYVKHIF